MAIKKNNYKDVISPQIKDIMTKQREDYDDIQKNPRFGFFSIIPNPVLGDRFYSQKNEFNHKVVEHKVISEKRGIFTMPGKKGKGHDAYFQSLDTTDEGCQERLIQGQKDDYAKKIADVQERKHRPVTATFRYPGVQHYKDYIYDLNPVERNFPLYKVPKKHYTVTKDYKVIIENKGIYTQPMKKGFNNTPGILFSYTPARENVEYADVKNDPTRERNIIKRPKTSDPSSKDYKKAFFPASLKKCECFSNIRETYGYEDDYYQRLKDYSDKVRKTNGPRFVKNLPKGSVAHMRPFTPSHLGKTGRDGLFNQRVWDCPQIPEPKVIVNQRAKKEYEKAHRKEPFKYNRMQDPSFFSPAVMTNTFNIKREFPTYYKH